MPVGFGRVKSKGRPHSVMTHMKKALRSQTRNELSGSCSDNSHRKSDKRPYYKAYRRGRKILPAVQTLIATTGIDLSEGAGIPEIDRFQDSSIGRACVQPERRIYRS
jgi:hypothetical protein